MSHPHVALRPVGSSNPFDLDDAPSGKEEAVHVSVGSGDPSSWEWAQFPAQQDQKEDVSAPLASLSLSSTIFPSHPPPPHPHSPPFDSDEEKKGEAEGEGVAPYCFACQSHHPTTRPFTIIECSHSFSPTCLAAYINRMVDSKRAVALPCPHPRCSTELSTGTIQALLTPSDFESYLHSTLMAFIDADGSSFICPNDACKSVISVAPFDPTSIPQVITEKDDEGQVLTREAYMHYCEYRVRCRECNLIFCTKCKVAPYHKGYTCAQYKEYQAARHCRFCSARLDVSNQWRHPGGSIALKDVCTAQDCVKKAESCCEKMLSCGCPCNGIKGEVQCLPCLKHDLAIADDYCSVCYVEALKDAPCIKMTGPCTHVVHYACALTKIESRWPGARISFEFRTCPLCKQNLQHPALEHALKPIIAMEQGIVEKALQRLKFEGREQDPTITQKGGEFFNNPTGFAMKQYLFYQCFKCLRPYFAGGYQCVDASVQGFDPSELICPSCQPSSVEDCKIHGKDWLAYKCRYCCSFANWYCLSEDMEVLTERGFMSRAEVFAACPKLVASLASAAMESDAAHPSPAASSSPLRFASLDPSTGHLEYQPATAVVVNTVTSLVEFTHAAEALHWAADADEYGLTPDQAMRMRRRSDRARDGDGVIERIKAGRLSNGVSLVVDAHHDMFARVGMTGFGKGDQHRTAWQSTDYRKVKAGSLLNDDTRQRVRMTGQAEAGLAASADADELPFAPVLGLMTEDEVTAFLLLHGYCLGDGCLDVRSRALRLSPKRPEDEAWLFTQLDAVGLTVQSGGIRTSRVDKANGQLNILIRDPRWVNYFSGEYGREYGVAPATSWAALELAAPKAKSVQRFCTWVWRLRKERARLVLDGLRLADGREAGGESVIITSGYTLRDDIIRLALHAGYSARFKLFRKAGDHTGYDAAGAAIVAQHDGWEVLYNDGLARAQPVLRNHRDIKRIDVPGGVQTWCVTVPPHNLIVTRRVTRNTDGAVTQASRPIVIGNCWGNTHFCDKCHKSGVWQQLTVFRSGKNKKKMWEYDNCATLKPLVEAVGKDASLSEEQKNAAIGKLLCAPKGCVLGVRHPPNGIEFGLGCSMCEDSQSSSEKLKENEAQVKAKLQTVKAELAKAPRTFRYQSDLDENGVMWYLGTCGRTQSYSNPAEAGFVKVVSSGLMGDSAPLSAAVGRELVRCVTTPVKNSWFVFELVDLALNLTAYTLRHYNSWDTECLRYWVLEGGNEGIQGPWEVIISHNNDAALAKKGATHTWTVPRSERRYRYFRLFQNGKNSNNNYYLPCSGIELYGTLYVQDHSGGEVASPRNKVAAPSPPPTPVPRPVGVPPAAPRLFTYRHDLDTNGIMYFMGCRFGQAPYQNPADLGFIRITCSELSNQPPGAPINAVVGREVVRVVSVPKPNQWFAIDLTPSGHRVRPSAYTLRHYSSWDLEALRNWKFEGSINGRDWYTLSVHTDDTSLDKKGATHTWQLHGQQGQFTQFRVWQTGYNSNGHHYLALSGFEVYGELTDNSQPLGSPFDQMRAQGPPVPMLPPPPPVPNIQGHFPPPPYVQQPHAHPFPMPHLPPPPPIPPIARPVLQHGQSVPILHRPPPPLPGPMPGGMVAMSHLAEPPTATLVPLRYHHDLDTCGLFYYLGTKGGSQPWQNPCTARLVSITCSGLATNPPSVPASSLAGRELVRCVTIAKPDQWFCIDLQSHALQPSHYMLQHYSAFDTEALRHWKLEGSQDAMQWDVLSLHVNDTSLQKKGQPHTWPIPHNPHTQGKFYRFFRIHQTGPNSNNNHYLALSGVELYGWLQLGGGAVRNVSSPPAIPSVPPRMPMSGPPSLPPGPPPMHRPQSVPPPMPSSVPPVPSNPFATYAGGPSPTMPSIPPPIPPSQPRSSAPPFIPHAQGMPFPAPSQAQAPSPYNNPFADASPPPLMSNRSPPSGPAAPNPFSPPAPSPSTSHPLSPPHPLSIPHPLSTLSPLHVTPNPTPFPPTRTSGSPSSPTSSPPLSQSWPAVRPLPPPPLAPPTSSSPSAASSFPEGLTFDYSYDFDECGVLYWLGTRHRTAPWRNPDDLGLVKVTSVPLAVNPPSAPASAIVGREVVRCVTLPNRESWFCVDLVSLYVRPTAYTLRHYDSFDSEALRDWKLQGSNDGAKWSKLLSHKKDEHLQGKGSSHTWQIPHTKKSFRMFRILQTGKNSNGHWYCALSGFELYGQIFSQPPKQKD